MGYRKGTLRRRHNLTLVINVCDTAPISIFWALNGLNELPEVRFEFLFIFDWQIDYGFFTGPIMARTQILVYRWGTRARISALFRRRT